MSAGPEWGPLARLAGIWEGEQGEDVAYANETGKIGLTPYREHIDFKPFGPVENGSQVLYGLDYRMAAWRGRRRARSTPRSATGCGTPATARWSAASSSRGARPSWPGPWSAADATKYTLQASVGSQTYGILSNNWLDKNARAIRYEVTIDTSVEDEFTYTETTVIQHAKMPEEVIHTDGNTLRRIADA